MKIKNILILTMLLFLPLLSLKADQLQLSPVESEKTRERVLNLRNSHTIYFFNDNTIVYLFRPPYEKQTWSEWWNNVEHPQSDPQFYFLLEKWNANSSFQIYRYQWEQSSSTHPLEGIKGTKLESDYPYLIENRETGEMTLCQIWSLTDLGSFIIRYGDQCFKKGYQAGSAGRRF